MAKITDCPNQAALADRAEDKPEGPVSAAPVKTAPKRDFMNEQRDLTTPARARHIAYWVTTVLIAAEFASGGVIDLLHSTIFGGQGLGYPAYFDNIMGVWKILGAAAVLAPRFPLLKEWAYAGMFFTMTGAVASLIAVGDEGVGMVAAVIFTCLVIASWALRPSSRRLPETSVSPSSARFIPRRQFDPAFPASNPSTRATSTPTSAASSSDEQDSPRSSTTHTTRSTRADQHTQPKTAQEHP